MKADFKADRPLIFFLASFMKTTICALQHLARDKYKRLFGCELSNLINIYIAASWWSVVNDLLCCKAVSHRNQIVAHRLKSFKECGRVELVEGTVVIIRGERNIPGHCVGQCDDVPNDVGTTAFAA